MTDPSLSEEKNLHQEIKRQKLIIINPNSPKDGLPRQAFLDVWFIDDDIVIGGFGWWEYYEYEKHQKMKPLEAEEK